MAAINHILTRCFPLVTNGRVARWQFHGRERAPMDDAKYMEAPCGKPSGFVRVAESVYREQRRASAGPESTSANAYSTVRQLATCSGTLPAPRLRLGQRAYTRDSKR
jgi:hypothetical protein